jgi:DHA2 family multidrug resistance protein
MADPLAMPPTRRLVLTLASMGAVLMQVLDSTIANVALPHMQAALSASQDSIAWVLTSYIIASAIGTPLTGWLEGRLGRRNLFAVSVGGFTIASALCGASHSLAMMVVARGLQGLFGAFLNPLSQSVMLDIYPLEKRAQAMSIWGMGVMIGPIMGPIIGGWLTDSFDWRWIFYINLPVGIISGIVLWLMLDDGQSPRRRFDMLGFGLLALALASFQLMLDRGTQRDWFHSTEIIIEAGIAFAGLWMFVVHTLTSRAPLLSRVLFKDRNFIAANIILVLMVTIYMPGSVLISPMLQQLFGYSTTQAGMVMMPRGLGMMVGMLLAARLSGRIDLRAVVIAGFLLVGIGQWIMSGFELEMGMRPVIVSGLINGLGVGAVMMPLNLLAYTTLPATLRTEAASFYSLSRSLSASVSISIMTALIAHNTQVSHSDVSAHVTTLALPMLSGEAVQTVGALGGMLAAVVDREVNRQALMIAYLDDFWLMMWVCVAALPFVLLLRDSRRASTIEDVVVE